MIKEEEENRNFSTIEERIREFQKSKPIEAFSILQSFVLLRNRENVTGFSDEFLREQIEILKKEKSIDETILLEILKKLFDENSILEVFDSIRICRVENFLGEFKEKFDKQKWNEKSEKFSNFVSLLDRSTRNQRANFSTAVLQLFKPFFDEIQFYLRRKLDKHRIFAYNSPEFVKQSGRLLKIVAENDENSSFSTLKDILRSIYFSAVKNRVDSILRDRILDEPFDDRKLIEVICPKRRISFQVHPEFAKLFVLLNAEVPVSDILNPLLEQISKNLSEFGTKISLEQSVFLISCLSLIESEFGTEKVRFQIDHFARNLSTFWKIHVLHDVTADDWLNSKSYLENSRYSVFIDSLFDQIQRLEFSLNNYSAILPSKIVPTIILDFMKFVSYRYSSIQVSSGRTSQFQMDLIAFLLYFSKSANYFLAENESKFIQYGNELICVACLVCCPCNVLLEELEIIEKQTKIRSSDCCWLNFVRPDWTDGTENGIRSEVLTFFKIKSFLERPDEEKLLDDVIEIIFKDEKLNFLRQSIIQIVLYRRRWIFIENFIQNETDCRFFVSLSEEWPLWLVELAQFWNNYFLRCSVLCVDENCYLNEIVRSNDEKSLFLKAIRHFLVEIPESLTVFLQLVEKNQTQLTKRFIFAALFHRFLSERNFQRASVIHDFLTGEDHPEYRIIDRLFDRKSTFFRSTENPNFQPENLENLRKNLQQNLEILRQNFNVKTLGEVHSSSLSSIFTNFDQHRRLSQSFETTNRNNDNISRVSIEFDRLTTKQSIEPQIFSWRIDPSIVKRIEIDWSSIFRNLVVRLKSVVIHHLVTSRFEFQPCETSKLRDEELQIVENTWILLHRFADRRE